jgi:hypothetical protein
MSVALGCNGAVHEAPAKARAVAWVPEAAPDLGPIVARVGEVPIFAAEVVAQAERTGKAPRLALDDLVAFHLLAEKARATGVQPDAVTAIPHELLVQRLLEREFEPSTRPSDIPDDELRRLYERGKDTYVHPRLVEVAILAVYTGDLMKPERRAKLRAVAQELADFVAGRPIKTADDFSAIAGLPRWNGKVAFRRLLQGPTKPFGPAVGAAVVRLAQPGDTTPLVEDETGLYLARYLAERPAENVTFEAVRDELRKQVYPYWRQHRFIELSARLAKGHDVEAFPGKLAEALAASQDETEETP